MFPFEIDRDLVVLKQTEKPGNHWDFVFHDGFYYHRLPQKKIDELCHLKTLSKEFGVEFKSHEHFAQYFDKLCPEEEIKHTCELCGYTTTTSTRLDNHRGSRTCTNNRRKKEAEERGQLFIPDHKKVAVCTVCDKSFKDRYTLATHEKTKAHKACVRALREGRITPTTCAVCCKKFLGDAKSITKKFKRHLKESTKCHGLVNKNEANMVAWLGLYGFFDCKFSKTYCVLGNSVKIV